MAGRNSLRLNGMLFGIWLSLLYAFVADSINRVNLPGIPLPAPSNGFLGYYLGALVAGAIVGLVCTLPENSWLGALLGGVAGALLVFLAPWRNVAGSFDQTVGILLLTITGFLPLALILTPISLLVRFCVNRLTALSGEMLSISRIGLPLLATGLALVLGTSRMVSSETRSALYQAQTMIETGMKSASFDQLPKSLQDVQGFIPNATGQYSLDWSDDLTNFIGPVPTTRWTNSNFLIIARFQNGFSLACVFGPSILQPSCANFR